MLEINRRHLAPYRPRPNRELRLRAELLPEPELEFARGGLNPNPKFGLTEYGPYDWISREYPGRQIRIGLIGTGQTTEDCKAWLRRCQSPIESTEAKSRQHPRFPGFNEGTPFHLRLIVDALQLLTTNEIDRVVAGSDEHSRLDRALDLLDKKIELLLEDGSPQLILCALPEAIVESCGSVGGDELRRRRRGLTKAERALLRIIERDREVGQAHLFPEAFELEGRIQSTV